MTDFRMRKSFLALAAAFVCCISCIETNYRIGSELMPKNQAYTIYTRTIPIKEISMAMADSLSGYSSSRITIGAVRDDIFGLGTRSCALTLIPLFQDSLDLGKNPEFKSFHFAAAKDTVSYSRPDQERIFQTFKVYELEEPLDASVDFDCNKPVAHLDRSITKGSVVYTGDDSLSFNFSEEFGRRYLEELDDEVLKDIDSYLEKFPGIYIEADAPAGNGGRINMFDLQLGYNSEYGFIEGNYASLRFSSEFDGERKDTTLRFYYGATDFYDLDSLLTYSGSGSFPQYSLNLTSQETEKFAGQADDRILVEGGGGLKPKIAAKYLKKLTEDAIHEVGGDPNTAVINKASIVLPFEFPDDYTEMDHWPQILSPTCRVVVEPDEDGEGGSARFISLSDTSDENADQGDVNRSTLRYSPDITYHLQSLIRLDETDTSDELTQRLENGSFDVWFLIMANEVTVTTESGSSEMSELYNYLAYQSYYNDMYGYGYGYGSYGNYYSNYYTYAMMAAMYSSSSTTESISVQLDKDRYYNAVLNGPDSPDESKVPQLKLTFAIPIEEPEE